MGKIIVWTKSGRQELTPDYWGIISYDNELHRLDGPAVEYEDGNKMWYVNGQCLPKDEVENWIEENNINLSTEEGQIAFKLRFE